MDDRRQFDDVHVRRRRASGAGGAESGGPTPLRQGRSTVGSKAGREHNLPAELSSFVGRTAELAEIDRLFDFHRLVTLSGPPGVGKSRLAVRVAGALLPRFRDGAWLVELAGLDEPDLVPQAVASALHVPLTSGLAAVETLAEALSGQQVVLVLDNCEHLLEACSALVSRLLAVSPGLVVLTTSRQPLHVAGEVDWRVPALATPDASLEHDPAALLTYDAVRLFVERGQAVHPGFTLTAANAASVTRICTHLDGLPFAIELAAVWLRMLAPAQIAERLASRFSLLTRGEQLASERQRTLRSLIDWSYDQLSQREQALFRRLSVFAGGWTLEAAEALMDDGGNAGAATETLHNLATLIEKSLVVVVERERRARYRMLETLREYGLEKLRLTGEEARIRTRHLHWAMTLAESGALVLTGRYDLTWYDRMRPEIDNVRAALAWGRDHPTAPTGIPANEAAFGPAPLWAALRLASACYFVWFWRGQIHEGREWIEQLLALTGASDTASDTEADSRHARDLMRANAMLGLLMCHGGDPATAMPRLADSAERAAVLGDPVIQATVLMMLGAIALQAGDTNRATILMDDGYETARNGGAPDVAGTCQFYRAELALALGDVDLAEARFEDVLAGARAVDFAWGIAESLSGLARAAAARGDHARAVRMLRENLPVRISIDDRSGQLYTIERLALQVAAVGRAERAAMLLGAVVGLYARLGMTPTQMLSMRTVRDSAYADARASLGEAPFDRAFERGRQLSWSEAVDLALRDDLGPPVSEPDATAPDSLNAREQQIAALVGRGYTNRQVAEAAIISERTAEWYVARLRAKLGLETRAQIVAWAVRGGLVSE